MGCRHGTGTGWRDVRWGARWHGGGRIILQGFAEHDR